MRKTVLLVLCFLFTAAIAIGWADSIISIKIRGAAVNSRSSNTSLVVRVEKSIDNRELRIECESDDFSTSSGKTLDGDDTPIEMRFEFNFPRGEYECKGILVRNTDGRNKEFADLVRFFVS